MFLMHNRAQLPGFITDVSRLRWLSTRVSSAYQSLVSEGILEDNPKQRNVLPHLDDLETRLHDFESTSNSSRLGFMVL